MFPPYVLPVVGAAQLGHERHHHLGLRQVLHGRVQRRHDEHDVRLEREAARHLLLVGVRNVREERLALRVCLEQPAREYKLN